MEIKVDLNDFNANFTIFSLGSTKADKLKVTKGKDDNGKEIDKLIRGKKTWNVPGLKIIFKSEDGEAEVPNCSVRVMNTLDIEPYTKYRAEGVVLYKSWSSQNSFGVNHQFHIEKLVKVGAENNPKQG